jgi:hypothetical protein
MVGSFELIDLRRVSGCFFDLDAIYSSVQSARKTSFAKMVYITNGKIEEENHA